MLVNAGSRQVFPNYFQQIVMVDRQLLPAVAAAAKLRLARPRI
jgi:hypothetical protein